MAGTSVAQAPPASFYDLTLTALDGRSVDMAACRGRVVLVVNVASCCGCTVQSGGLEKLHRESAPRGFAFLGRSGKVPKWNFGKYPVGKDGQVVDLFSSDVTPESPTLREASEKPLVVPVPAGGEVIRLSPTGFRPVF